MATFKTPESLPQDLLLISELVTFPADAPKQQVAKKGDNDDDIASSGSDTDSEEEVEKDLTALAEEERGEGEKGPLPDSDSSYDSSSSETDSESEAEKIEGRAARPVVPPVDFDDEDDLAPSTGSYPQTKNELIDTVVTMPEMEEVGADEQLEKVGEITSIVDNVVIVKGLPSEYANRGSERALDCDSLLVFQDRKVFGYIYETFGPTSQPLYQIKFDHNHPLDPGKVRLGREVFHVPRRSHFVFINQLQQLKGSDASNVHDEEPAEDELEFSDDEAEAAHRSRTKRKRADSRTRSGPSSRHNTPTSQIYDRDMINEPILNGTAYDEHGPYDLDYNALPSRPAPKPYDDPYSDAYNIARVEADAEPSESQLRADNNPRQIFSRRDGSYPHSTGYRGRGRGRGRGTRGSIAMRGTSSRNPSYRFSNDADTSHYGPRAPRASPPSPRFPGHNDSPFNFSPTFSTADAPPSWGYPSQPFEQMQVQQEHMFPGSTYHPPYIRPPMLVQPHINPRFASAFGLTAVQSSPTLAQESAGSLTSRDEVTPYCNWSEQCNSPVVDRTIPEDERPDP